MTDLAPQTRSRVLSALRGPRIETASWAYGNSGTRFKVFAQQGVPPASASLVYAVNTLHVARDLDRTLREIFQTLAPGGRLVFSECIRTTSAQAIYVEFIFNLLETFRAPVLNPTYRPNGGFLTPEQWRGAMEAAGFVDVALLPDIVAMRSRFPDFNVGAIGATRPA